MKHDTSKHHVEGEADLSVARNEILNDARYQSMMAEWRAEYAEHLKKLEKKYKKGS